MNTGNNNKRYPYPAMLKCFFIFIFATFFMLAIVGCEELLSPSDQEKIGPEEEAASIESENSNSTEEESSEEETIESEEQDEQNEDLEEPEEYSISINIYYVDEQAQFLIGEERLIIGTYKEDFIEKAFKELSKEPTTENIFNIIPLGTEIINLEFVDNIAFLNLTSDFVDNKWEDGLIDVLVINCIAATITEIPDVEAILIKIENKKLDKYGSLDISIPIRKNTDLIK
ncbi:MAG: GerMN domain-containing protein [Actinomycetia bacterium]|nr:GerMN domain-containing protein [Actinomycetes bacterium]